MSPGTQSPSRGWEAPVGDPFVTWGYLVTYGGIAAYALSLYMRRRKVGARSEEQ